MAEQASRPLTPEQAAEADPENFDVNQAWPAGMQHPATLQPEAEPQPQPQQPEPQQ